MKEWKAILNKALIGTDRSSDDIPMETLQQYGFGKAHTAPAQILEASAVFGLFQRAGWTPEINTIDKSIKVVESKQVASDRMGQLFQLLLRNKRSVLMQEFLELMEKYEIRLSPEFLPEILDYGIQKVKLRPTISKVIGEKGYWLSKLNPNWDYLDGQLPENDWSLLSTKERLSVLNLLRVSDTEKALKLIEQEWPNASVQEKSALLSTISIGLNAKDEPFLERCLDDSRKEIRSVAAEYLAQLPDSAYVKRMVQRVVKLFKLKKGSLSVKLNENCSSEMKRDGINPKSDWIYAGLKASLFAQMLSKVPVSYWRTHFRKSPSKLITHLEKDLPDYFDLFMRAIALSTLREKDESWLNAIVGLYAKKPLLPFWKYVNISDFCYCIDNDGFNELAIEAILKGGLNFDDRHPAVKILMVDNKRWTKQLTLLVIGKLQKAINHDNYISHWGLKPILAVAASAVAPELLETVRAEWPENSRNWSSWSEDVYEFISGLEIRRDLYNELKQIHK